MNSYMSGFSDLIEKYECYQKASGSWSENANGLNIKYFDRYCALHYPGQPLCQEMVDAWCRKRETETNASCFTRTGGIRSFIHYLRERGLTTVEPALSRKEGPISPILLRKKNSADFFMSVTGSSHCVRN